MPLGPAIPGVPGISAWKAEVMQRALRVNLDLNLLIDNEFDASSAASTSVGGTGTVAYDTGLTGGVARLRTGILLGSSTTIYNAGGSILVGNPKTESWYAHSRCAIQDVPTSQTKFHCIGMQDTPATTGVWVAFGLLGQYDMTYLTLEMNLGGGSFDFWVSKVAAEIGVFRSYGIGRDAVNDKVYALVDNNPILELDGPFPNLTVNPCFFYSFIGTGTGAQDVELWVDNIATVVQQVN